MRGEKIEFLLPTSPGVQKRKTKKLVMTGKRSLMQRGAQLRDAPRRKNVNQSTLRSHSGPMKKKARGGPSGRVLEGSSKVVHAMSEPWWRKKTFSGEKKATGRRVGPTPPEKEVGKKMCRAYSKNSCVG